MMIHSALLIESIRGQFEAALTMLAAAIHSADDDVWLAPVGKRAYWEGAFHTAFYTHLYLAKDLDSFEGLPDFAGPNSAGLGRRAEPPFDPIDPGPPVDRRRTLEYVCAAYAKLTRSLAAETAATLAGASGFFWLPFTRAELYFYNGRHIQHHTGQLHTTLRQRGIEPQWKGTGWSEPVA